MCNLFLTQKATAALIPVIGYRRLPSLYRCVDLRPRRSDAVSTLPRVFYILYAWLYVLSVGRWIRPKDGTKVSVFFERGERTGRIFFEISLGGNNENSRFDLSGAQIRCWKVTMILACFLNEDLMDLLHPLKKNDRVCHFEGCLFVIYIYMRQPLKRESFECTGGQCWLMWLQIKDFV